YPTEAAARQHFLQTHLQIEMWNGNILNFLILGWKPTKHGLFPLTTNKAAAERINSMFCKCTKECYRGCTCNNNDMRFTGVCKGWKGQSCKNSPIYDKSEAILAIQEDGKVDEEVSCELLLKKIKPN
ncbi:hypothetical protein ILUMI_18938, partial [Ignelater luminosus]